MKKYGIGGWLLLLLAAQSVFAQPGYQVTYRLHGRQTGQGVLNCTDRRSVYTVGLVTAGRPASQVSQPNDVIAGAMKRVDVDAPVALNKKPVLIRNIQTQAVEYAEEDTPYQYTVEENTPLAWTLVNEFRKIGSFTCQKAQTVIKGREYTVWFTKEIPHSAGPWKLAGLPGLILEAVSTDQKYQFLFASCVSVKPGAGPAVTAFAQPKLSYAQYVQSYNQYYQNLANKIYKETASGFLQRFGVVEVKPVTMKVENIDKNLEKNFVSVAGK